MTSSSEIPHDRLPEGFARRVRPPENPATPRPAATVVLMRPVSRNRGGLEVLLLRRIRSAGFVPGAWVFPGGRVDDGDADPRLVSQLDDPGGAPASALVAAIREAFEETGILLARDARGDHAPPAASDPDVDRLRIDLLEGALSFLEILDHGPWRMDPDAVGYIAHWITPEAEPRRYDTRFFAAAVAAGTPERIHDAELTHSAWLTPAEALHRHADGELPMIFPTIKTLEALRPFESPAEVLEYHRGREIPAILPTLVHTPTGVGVRMPDEH